MSTPNPFYTKVINLINKSHVENEAKLSREVLERHTQKLLAELTTLFKSSDANPNARALVDRYLSQDKEGRSQVKEIHIGMPLLSAVIEKAPSYCVNAVVQFLISKNANVNFTELSCSHHDLFSPINMAIRRGSYALVKLLIDNQAIVSVKESSEPFPIDDPLVVACYEVRNKALRTKADNSHRTNVQYSAESLGIVKLLLDSGARIIIQGQELISSVEQDCPLQIAIEHQVLPLVELLLSRNASVRQTVKAMMPAFYGVMPKYRELNALQAAFHFWKDAENRLLDYAQRFKIPLDNLKAESFFYRESVREHLLSTWSVALVVARKYIADLGKRAFQQFFVDQAAETTPEQFLKSLRKITCALVSEPMQTTLIDKDLIKQIYHPACTELLESLKTVSGQEKKYADEIIALIMKENPQALGSVAAPVMLIQYPETQARAQAAGPRGPNVEATKADNSNQSNKVN